MKNRNKKWSSVNHLSTKIILGHPNCILEWKYPKNKHIIKMPYITLTTTALPLALINLT